MTNPQTVNPLEKPSENPSESEPVTPEALKKKQAAAFDLLYGDIANNDSEIGEKKDQEKDEEKTDEDPQKKEKEEKEEKEQLAEKINKLPQQTKIFLRLLSAANKQKEAQKPTFFESFAVNEHGNRAKQAALITDISVNGQTWEAEKVFSAIINNKITPETVAIKMDIAMGNGNETAGVYDLQLTMPLLSLERGGLSEKLQLYINYVLYAATLHYRETQEQSAIKANNQTEKVRLSLDNDPELAKHNIQILHPEKTEAGKDPSTVTEALRSNPSGTLFNLNNGQVWGIVKYPGEELPKEFFQVEKDSTEEDIAA